MATIEELKQKITTLKNAGLPYDDELKQLQALQEQPEEPVVTVAKELGAVEVPAEEEGEWFEFSVTVNPDTLGGGDYYPPEKEGIWRSRLVDIVTPASADKNEQLFIVETADDRLEKQGRGALVHRLDSAAWVLTRTLDNLGVPYTVDGSQVNYRIKLPMTCESEWQKIKTKAGKTEIRIQNIYAVGKAPTPVL
jgi:hypothetical protein